MPAEPTRSPQPSEQPGQTVAEKSASAADVAQRRDVDREQIAHRAYERFEARGGEHGRDQEDWLEAEQELKGARGE